VARRIAVGVDGRDRLLDELEPGGVRLQQHPELVLEPVAADVQKPRQGVGGQPAQAGLRVADRPTGREPEGEAADRVAEPAAHRHGAGERPRTQDDAARCDAGRDPRDIHRRVLAVGIGGDDPGTGEGPGDVREARAQGRALASVLLMGQDEGAGCRGRREHVTVGRPRPVVDDDHRHSVQFPHERDEALVGLVRGDQDDVHAVIRRCRRCRWWRARRHWTGG